MRLFKKWWFWVVISLIIIAIFYNSFIGPIRINEYEKFRFPTKEDLENQCEHYYQECTCYGSLLVLESYPMQYKCTGINTCKDINPPRVECK